VQLDLRKLGSRKRAPHISIRKNLHSQRSSESPFFHEVSVSSVDAPCTNLRGSGEGVNEPRIQRATVLHSSFSACAIVGIDAGRYLAASGDLPTSCGVCQLGQQGALPRAGRAPSITRLLSHKKRPNSLPLFNAQGPTKIALLDATLR